MERMKKSTKIFAAVALVIPGAVVGFVLGMLAINLIPDQCVTTGISTICENPIGFLGLDGYEATGVIGLLLGAIGAPAAFLIIASKKS